MGKVKTHDAERVAALFDKDHMYTAQEVADIVGISKSLVYRAAVIQEELGYLRLGNREGVRIPGHAAKDWVRSRWGAQATRGAASPRAARTTSIDGTKVHEYREKRQMSLRKLSNKSGVSKSAISDMERHGKEANCKIENARAIARSLGIKPKTLGVKEAAYG